MTEFHRLDPTADARFLRSGVADPLTRVPFRPSNEVVLCATCGTVSLRETWEAVGGCPKGHDTAARWSATAALAGGDGAATAPPRPRTAPATEEEPSRGWLSMVLLAIGAAGLLVLGVVVFGLMTDEGEAPVEQVVVPTGPTGPEAIAVTEPGLIEGELTADDFETEDARYQDLYTFAADSSGRVLTFRVSSDDFEPDLVVETPEGDRIEGDIVDENGDTGTVTVAVGSLRAPGLYRIRISSRRPSQEGAYAFRIRSEEPVRPLAAGGPPVQATLGEFSERADGFFRDRYQFRGVSDREHTLTVRSSEFAPILEVRGPDGVVRGETGRAGGVVTFVFTPGQTGTHTVVVSSQTPDTKGKYAVELAVEPEVEATPEPAARPLSDGVTARDSLAVGASQAYGIRGRVGDRIRLEVRTDGFTPSLVLVGPDGSRTVAEPDGDRARITLTLQTAGTYRAIVGAPEGSGEARISLEQRAAVTADDIPRFPGAGGAPASPPADDGDDGGTDSPPPSRDGDAPDGPGPGGTPAP
ncbi:hypothetical protein [Rubrivirga sp. IMCC43871]|uniref:hypothetical protein n=1 Tax=Rubrivirga sp. IMCC43871 TaxID=3391575 RepID=UPI0039901101